MAPRSTHPGAVALLEAVETLSTADVHLLDAGTMVDVLADIEYASRRLAGVRAALLAAVEADGRWAADGSRSFPAWWRRTTGASSSEAWRQAHTALSLRDHLPATAEALEAGRITPEHAHLMAVHTTKTPERLAALGEPEVGEGFLVEQAAHHDATEFARLVRGWAIAADPGGADADHAERGDRQELVLAKVLHGWHVQGWLDDIEGTTLEAALDAVIGTPDATDTRTTAQRRAAALLQLARLAVDGGTQHPGAGVRPHLTVHVSYDTLTALVAAQAPAAGRAGAPDPFSTDAEDPGEGTIPGDLDYTSLVGVPPAELGDGTPLPPSALARLACDSELARVIFGPTGEVLDAGRARRLFPTGMRRAILARDGTCQFPGCDAPPRSGEIHHSLWWYAHHGATSTDNGILLCWHHHAYVHRHHITITRSAAGAGPDPSGDDAGPSGAAATAGPGPSGLRTPRPRWVFTRPNGIEVTGGGRRRARTSRAARSVPTSDPGAEDRPGP